MTANSEETKLLATDFGVDSREVGHLGIAPPAYGGLRVVAAAMSDRPGLSLGSAPLPLPPSSADISTLSGPLDLSRSPSGLERPKAGVSCLPQESDVDTTADARSRDPAGLLDERASPAASRGSANFETRAPQGLEGHLKGKTGSRAALTVGPACREAASAQSEGPLSIEMKRTGFDSHLARTIDAWPSLPVHVRETIVTIIDAALNG